MKTDAYLWHSDCLYREKYFIRGFQRKSKHVLYVQTFSPKIVPLMR